MGFGRKMTGQGSLNLAGAETVESGKFHRGSRDLGPRMSNPGLNHKKMVFVFYLKVCRPALPPSIDYFKKR